MQHRIAVQRCIAVANIKENMIDRGCCAEPAPERCFRSGGHMTVRNVRFDWHSEAQDYDFFNENGEKEVSVLVTSFTKDGEDSSARSVLFVLPGGPGGDSISGIVTQYGPFVAAENAYVDNDEWMLGICDIVAFDSVGTGYRYSCYKNSPAKHSVLSAFGCPDER